MKNCIRCKLTKSLDSFTKLKASKDGCYTYCRECVKKRHIQRKEKRTEEEKEKLKRQQEKYRTENRLKINEDARKVFWENREKTLEKNRACYYKYQAEIALRRKEKRNSEDAKVKENLRMKEWRTKNPQSFRSSIRRWQQTNKEKHNCHQRVSRAVKDGTLIRKLNCEECGKECKTEGHHEDYNKPLDVIWLCRRCHASKIQIVGV